MSFSGRARIRDARAARSFQVCRSRSLQFRKTRPKGESTTAAEKINADYQSRALYDNKSVAARHRSRQRALQVLYQWDLTKQPVENAISSFYDTLFSEEEEARKPERDAFMEELAVGTSQMA